MDHKLKNVDEYIKAMPDHARKKLEEMRALLRSVAPEATEELKWGQPVFMEKRILFSYAAFKNHIRFMPTGPVLEQFRSELASYKRGKDTIQFPYDRPLPQELIKRIAAFRRRDVLENDAKWRY